MTKPKTIPPLSPKELRRLQLMELELLMEFDRICRKNNIKYTIIGGTLLGAVRHKGFIPWDDDADVGLLRSDYDKFVKACQHDLDHDRFYFQDRFKTPEYRWGYGKLRRHNTHFVRPNTEHMSYAQGVYIDVMPLDYIPNSKFGQLICNMIAFFLRKASWAEIGKNTEKKVFYKILYSILSSIPLQIWNRLYKRFVKYLNRKKTNYLRCISVPIITSKKYKGYWRYKTAWLNHMKEYNFEGYSLMGISNYDAALQRMYGDYMKPVRFPPVSLSKYRPLPLSDIDVDEKLKLSINPEEKICDV